MTAILERPQAPPAGGGRADAAPGRRAFGWLADRRTDLVLIALLVVVAVWLQAINMYGAPARTGDEGTYVAQAWSVAKWHMLAPYTYWFDHPPFGWILMGGYDTVTNAFRAAPSAVDGGRQFMLLCMGASEALLFILARRVGASRWSAAVVGLLFAASPLAISFHRQVYLDNIAVPFALAAFVLALSPGRRLAAQAAAGLCFGLSVMSKETFLLLLPAVVWQLWRHADRRTRGFVMVLASCLFLATVGVYVLYATLDGELFPGPGHVSLIGTALWQLGGRAASGSVLSSGTPGHATVTQWSSLDPWLPLFGLLTMPVMLVRRSTRALGLAALIQAATLLRPGYLPFPFVIGALPFAALDIGLTLDTVGTLGHRRAAAVDIGEVPAAGTVRRLVLRPIRHAAGSVGWVAAGPMLALCLAVGAISMAGPTWVRNDRGLFTANADAPYLAAQHWVVRHVSRHDRLLVGDSLWVDMVQAGFPANQVVWYSKLSSDPAVERRFPRGWRDFQYIVWSNSLRGSVGTPGYSWLAQAKSHSTRVAGWGQGATAVEVLRVDTSG